MIQVDDVTKVYRQGETEVRALDGVSVTVDQGTFAAIMGPSGSGKSTLLHLMGALDQPTTGTVRVDGQSIGDLDDDARTVLRREKLAFVFQFFNLLPTMSAVENVCLPALLGGRSRAELRSRAVELLDMVGLSHRVDHRPREMSGGEMQRVALARALILEAPVLLADEPTGNVDSGAGEEILELLQRASRELSRTIVMVTHDPRAAGYADRTIRLKDGLVVE